VVVDCAGFDCNIGGEHHGRMTETAVGPNASQGGVRHVRFMERGSSAIHAADDAGLITGQPANKSD